MRRCRGRVRRLPPLSRLLPHSRCRVRWARAPRRSVERPDRRFHATEFALRTLDVVFHGLDRDVASARGLATASSSASRLSSHCDSERPPRDPCPAFGSRRRLRTSPLLPRAARRRVSGWTRRRCSRRPRLPPLRRRPPTPPAARSGNAGSSKLQQLRQLQQLQQLQQLRHDVVGKSRCARGDEERARPTMVVAAETDLGSCFELHAGT